MTSSNKLWFTITMFYFDIFWPHSMFCYLTFLLPQVHCWIRGGDGFGHLLALLYTLIASHSPTESSLQCDLSWLCLTIIISLLSSLFPTENSQRWILSPLYWTYSWLPPHLWWWRGRTSLPHTAKVRGQGYQIRSIDIHTNFFQANQFATFGHEKTINI